MSGTVSIRPLKILHLGKYFHPDPGGIESFIRDIVQSTVRAGCGVAVLCMGRVAQLQEEDYYGALVLRAPIWKIVASQPLGWAYFRTFFRRARDFDIVHVHAPNMLAALALLMSRVPGKIVVHWHADVVGYGLIGKLIRPLEWLMLRRADVLVATSQAYADASPLLRQFRDKIHIAPPGVVDPLGDPEPAAAGLSVLGEGADSAPMILAVGRLVPYKGFEILIDAARELPRECRVVIVGGGELKSALAARIRERDVQDRVILAGRVNDASLQALFRRASVFCLPSITRAEAFGLVMLEAMAHGLPIVATNIPGSGVPWVNQHGITGLNVPAGDAPALAAALVQMLRDPDLCVRLGRQSRARFEKEFTLELATRRYMELYTALACAPGAQAPA